MRSIDVLKMIMKKYDANVSPNKTATKMATNLLLPSDEWIIAFVFL